MCIAIASMKGNPSPSKDYLNNCWINNPDGAGFCFANNGMVVIKKGFMTWESFWNTYEKYNRRYDFDTNSVLIHFRIATHGGINRECCHPFPVVADAELMRRPESRSKYAVIHNGIISLTGETAKKKEKMSDTMVFVEDYLSKIATNDGWFENNINMELIHDLIDSKMAIMNGEGDIQLTEGFAKDKEDGNFYSNTSYSDYYGYGRCYGAWSEWDEWDEWSMQTYGLPAASDSSSVSYAKQIPMMKLKSNEIIIFDDGGIEYYDADDKIDDYYMTEEGDIYWGIYLNTSNKMDAVYMGKGSIMTNGGESIEFRKDIYCKTEGLDGYVDEDEVPFNVSEEGSYDDGEITRIKYADDKVFLSRKRAETTLDTIKRHGFEDVTPDSAGLFSKKFVKNGEYYNFYSWSGENDVVLRKDYIEGEIADVKKDDEPEVKCILQHDDSYVLYSKNKMLTIKDIIEKSGFKDLTPDNSMIFKIYEKDDKRYFWDYGSGTENCFIMRKIKEKNEVNENDE